MWPWGHLAVGYLVYATWSRYRTGRPPKAGPAIVLAVATQLPDLIDKPLAWWFSVLPTGRSLGHSLLVALVLVSGVWWLAVREDRGPLAVAFGVGYLAHLAGDALYPALGGDVASLTFLAWPVLAPPEYELGQSVAAHLAVVTLSPTFLFELVALFAAAGLWAVDGYPGLGVPRRLGRVLVPER